MPLISVTIDDKEVRTLLTGIQTRAKNLSPAMRIIGEIVRASVVKNFEDEGRPAKWQKSKRASSQGGQTLTDTARLRRSITSKAFTDRAEIGTNVKYAAIHQFGGVIKAKSSKYLKFRIGGQWAQKKQVTIPARPFLMVQNGDWPEIKISLGNYLIGGNK